MAAASRKSKSSASDGWDRAIRLLARRDRSEAELRADLAARGIAASAIAAVVRRLRRFGYIDDHRFARTAAEQARQRGYGSAYLAHRLHAAGIAEHLVTETVATAFADEAALAAAAVARRFGHTDPGPARVARYLLSHGFAEDVVFAIVGEAC